MKMMFLYLMIILYVLAGINHFLNAKMYLKIVPILVACAWEHRICYRHIGDRLCTPPYLAAYAGDGSLVTDCAADYYLPRQYSNGDGLPEKCEPSFMAGSVALAFADSPDLVGISVYKRRAYK